jgi:hypothetical protein
LGSAERHRGRARPVRSRRRDTARRRLQVHNAIAQLRADGAAITVSSIARAARVHRSFIHRHLDLHAAVAAAAQQPAEPVPTSSTVSVASLLPICSTPAPRTTGYTNASAPWKPACPRLSVRPPSATAASVPPTTSAAPIRSSQTARTRSLNYVVYSRTHRRTRSRPRREPGANGPAQQPGLAEPFTDHTPVASVLGQRRNASKLSRCRSRALTD